MRKMNLPILRDRKPEDLLETSCFKPQRKTWITFLILITTSLSFGQAYIPFPTGNAQWNQVIEIWDPVLWEPVYYNYQYVMQGDTMIQGTSYKKMFSTEGENGESDYIGGLREDGNKNIYFYPAQTWVGVRSIEFPSDTSEYLLFTFNNLEVGSVFNINSRNIEVLAIDSVLFGNNYHKIYRVLVPRMDGYEWWIEGIGSTLDLFTCYNHTFEERYVTLCFKPDSINTYFISSPYLWGNIGGEWCDWNVPTKDHDIENNIIYPNPVMEDLTVRGKFGRGAEAFVYDFAGQKVLHHKFENLSNINTRDLLPGIYSLVIINGDQRYVTKFIKLKK